MGVAAEGGRALVDALVCWLTLSPSARGVLSRVEVTDLNFRYSHDGQSAAKHRDTISVNR